MPEPDPRSAKLIEDLVENGYKQMNSPQELQASPRIDEANIMSNIYYKSVEKSKAKNLQIQINKE